MTATATVTTRQALLGGLDVEEIVVDCPHGTTTGQLVNGHKPGAPGRDELVALLAGRHEVEEGCGCALPLLATGGRA